MFYTGIVEDRNDPLELGRVRVRFIGLHTPDKALIPTDTLPWATVLHPATSAANGGIGITPKLVIGSHVLCFFMDGDDMQMPVVMGTLAGIQEKDFMSVNGQTVSRTDTTKGFNSYVHPDYIGQSDLPKNARSGAVDKPRARISVENSLFSFEEPEDLRASRQYPYIQVKQSEAGHYEEWDDTPGNERISTNHKTGTFTEMRPDGSYINKIVNDRYTIVSDNDNVYINGHCNVHIKGDSSIFVEGDMNTMVAGNYRLNVAGDYIETIGKTKTVMVTTDINMVAGEKLTIDGGTNSEISMGADLKLNITGNMTTNIGGTLTERIAGAVTQNYIAGLTQNTQVLTTNVNGNKIDNVGGNASSNAAGTNTVQSGSVTTIRGSRINLNDSAPNVNIEAVEFEAPEFQDFDVPEFEYVAPVISGINPDITLQSSQGGLRTTIAGDSAYSPVQYSGISGGTEYNPGNSGYSDMNFDDTLDPNIAGKSTGVEGLLSFIASGEGGYDSANNGTVGNRIVGSELVKKINGKLLSAHTIAEIINYQKGSISTGRTLFAVGRYQIIPSTMSFTVAATGLSLTEVFNKENQDLMGISLLIGNGKGKAKRPKLAAYLLGKSDDLEGAMLDMAKEWASVPSPFTGRSYYGSGNKSSHSVAQVAAALKSARQDLANENINVASAKNIVPGTRAI